MGKITKYLNQLIVGNVFDNPEILEMYSTDRSVLQVKPKFVAFPESTEDIRKLTPREWARLQGFPDTFKIVVADASAYKQFGNSVAIPAIQATAEKELQLLGLI